METSLFLSQRTLARETRFRMFRLPRLRLGGNPKELWFTGSETRPNLFDPARGGRNREVLAFQGPVVMLPARPLAFSKLFLSHTAQGIRQLIAKFGVVFPPGLGFFGEALI